VIEPFIARYRKADYLVGGLRQDEGEKPKRQRMSKQYIQKPGWSNKLYLIKFMAIRVELNEDS